MMRFYLASVADDLKVFFVVVPSALFEIFCVIMDNMEAYK